MSNTKARISLFGGAVLCCLAMVIGLVALLRFGFASGHIWLFDLQKYLFAVLVPVSVLVAFLRDRHVRAGVFDLRDKPGFSLFECGLLVALPTATLGLFLLPVLFFSWSQLETSGEIGGLPGYFVAKSVLAICLFSIVVVAIARCFERRGSS